jgi:hypothetical protein
MGPALLSTLPVMWLCSGFPPLCQVRHVGGQWNVLWARESETSVRRNRNRNWLRFVQSRRRGCCRQVGLRGALPSHGDVLTADLVATLFRVATASDARQRPGRWKGGRVLRAFVAAGSVSHGAGTIDHAVHFALVRRFDQ